MAGYYGGYLGNEAGMTGMLAGSPSFDLNRRPGALGGRSGEQLKRLYEGGTKENQQLNDELLKRGIMPGAGPQLPLAFDLPGAAGNLGALAQAMPGAAGNLGGMLGFPGGSPQFALRPSIEMENEQLKVGGNATIPLGSAEALMMQGQYVPGTNEISIKGSLGKPPGTPGFGIDFGYTKSPRSGGGFYGGVNGVF
jgi:hypothetical protein